MFALGECSEPFVRANLGARIFGLRKPNGRLRPVARGSVLRRLAARVLCSTCKDQIRAACGGFQFAVGQQAGCERVHKTVSALTCASPGDVVLQFDCSNAFNSMPRQLILDAVRARAPSLLHAVSVWLSQPTAHLFWGESSRASPIRASTGVDQGCPLSPALFAIGLAAPLERIHSRLALLSPRCRVFSYLDDVMVVVPGADGEAALDAVVEELQGVGLTVNADKTAAWTLDPGAPLPGRVQGLRVDRCKVLGATAPWLDPDEDYSRLGVHSLVEGSRVVQSAEAFVAKLGELRGAGLSARACFLLLQAYSQGRVTHLLQAQHDTSGWVEQFDEVLLRGLESLVGGALDHSQRTQAFLRLSEGGLGLGSAVSTREAAFLGSWALALSEVAGSVGATTWEGFRSKCGPIAARLVAAEAELLRVGAGALQPVDWVGLLSEPRSKLQAFWTAKLQEQQKARLLQSLDTDAQVDLRSAGGRGTGGFLQPP